MKRKCLHVWASACAWLALSTLASAQDSLAQQDRQGTLMYLGVQCGNAVDTSSLGCSIGTIGALVTDRDLGIDYLLSNNHVFARSNSASLGEDIMHTSADLCDLGAYHVGELSAYVPINTKGRSVNRVDAALARVVKGNTDVQTDAGGRVLLLKNDGSTFAVENTPVTAYVNMPVAKSGRTTGFKTGVVTATNVNVAVSYDNGRATFVDQIAISDGSFSAGGDSGSLVVSNDPSAYSPVGLLFAGSSTMTIANHIDDVLTELASQLGAASLAFGSSGDIGFDPGSDGGGDGGGSDKDNPNKGGGNPNKPSKKSALTIPEAAILHAAGIRDRFETEIMSLPGVEGSGISLSADGRRPVIQIYTSVPPASVKARLPRSMQEIEVQVIETGIFEAY